MFHVYKSVVVSHNYAFHNNQDIEFLVVQFVTNLVIKICGQLQNHGSILLCREQLSVRKYITV